jgi:hypothetical protein
MQGYQIHKVLVKHQLQKAVSNVHIAFDLWTSGNYLSLNGIVAHFIDADFKPSGNTPCNQYSLQPRSRAARMRA